MAKQIPRLLALAARGLTLPCECVLCGDAIRGQIDLCHACQSDLPANSGARCQTCCLPTTGDRCPNCRAHPPGCNICDAPFLYRYPVDALIIAFKQHRNLPAGEALVRLAPIDLVNADALVPVPLHWRRQRARGYNQSLLMAETLSRRSGIPVFTGVSRRRATAPQKALSRRERTLNLANAFRVSPEARGLRLTIVDDVITTGATVTALASALIGAGAERADAWCLARTEAP